MDEFYREVSESKLPTVSGILEKDVHSIWECVSDFIEKQMSLHKGVHISGLGTFSFSQQKIDTGNKQMSLSRPVFVFSERLISSLGLTCSKPYTPGNIHIVSMNYATIAFETNFSRDVAENCVKELLSAFYRAINNEKNVDLIFNKIGRLSVRRKKCKMKFYKQFIELFDKSGSLVQAMQQRFDTPDSVVTERSQVKSSQIVLPGSLKAAESPCQMNQVLEENFEENVPEALPEEPLVTDDGLDENPFVPALELNQVNVIDNVPAENTPVHSPPAEFTPVADVATNVIIENVMRTNFERNTGAGILITGQNITNPDMSHRTDENENFSNRSVYSLEDTSTKAQYGKPNFAKEAHTEAFNNCFPVLEKSRSAGSLNRTRRSSYRQSHTAREPVVQACCDHHGSGQEICYLCHQREQRNVYMPFTEEKARRDKEEDLLLRKYSEMKNTEHLLQEKEKKALLKRELHDMQKSNFEVAEMKHARKKERDVNFMQSYLFHHRPETPPLFTKMLPYSKELQKQIELKNLASLREQEKENFESQAEQINLATSLTKQREDYFKERSRKMNLYKTILDKQVHEKTLSQQQSCGIEEEENIREGEGAGYFGKNDVTAELLAEKKRKANEVMKEQFKMMAQRKREEILKRMKEQREEEKILRKNRTDLLNDRAMKCQLNYELYKDLESDWKHRAMLKQQNLQKAKEKAQQLDMLLQDQCNRYHRCQQCKRCLWNRGSGNIWADTYFIPGSRYFI
ncbi:coiled-coil domain-containing protein 81 [Octopus bimaculoides]|nr:coiled-coil domain-containing protein 81 [Octopus bimaculoides]